MMLGGDNTLMMQALMLAAYGMGTVFSLLCLLIGCIALLPRLAALSGTTAAKANNTSATEIARRAALAAAQHHYRRHHGDKR